MADNQFVIEAEEVKTMKNQSGLSLPNFLTSLVKPAKQLARPPISKFDVGAVGLGSDGRIFFGVNLEFPGLPLHHSVHAEQFLITNAALVGSTKIDCIAVSAAPCGHCRQFLQELRGAAEIKILIISDKQNDDADTFRPLSDFLPHQFGPGELLQDLHFILESHNNSLILDIDDEDSDRRELKQAAFEAANVAHAPYTGCPSGVALMDSDGRIFVGSYLESAAYNPSLGPVQAALVSYVACGGGRLYDEIVAAVLVEKVGAVVAQESTARMLLRTISPCCDFEVLRCRSLTEA